MKSAKLFSSYGAAKIIALFVLSIAISGCQFPFSKRSTYAPEPGSNRAPCVVLALPDSGPYAPIAAEIKKGANLAQAELKAQGYVPRMEYINTESSDWIMKLDSLPPQCAVVGGPLQEKAYIDAKKAGALQKRVFFAFMPTLQQGDEGLLAWRFFPSPHDQIEALTSFGINDLNVRSFAAFFPEDAYGKKMTDLLEKNLAQKNITLRKASYNPAAPATWSRAVAPLINPVIAGNKNKPVPQTDFEALFLPDSWKNMDRLTSGLMANGEDSLILMGTTLWEAGLHGKQVPKAAKYELAIFPGAWDKNRASKALQASDNDFWVALGYDFTNFAASMGLENRLAGSEIIIASQKSSPKIRAMAPLSWDQTGNASQKLYLFQVGPSGMKPVNVKEFQNLRKNARERAALRIQAIHADVPTSLPKEEAPEMISYDLPQKPVKLPPSAPVTTVAPSTTQTPAVTQPLSNVPQPSYKLRLPTKK